MPDEIEKLKALLPVPFAADQLLLEALTHRSYAVEHNLDYDNHTSFGATRNRRRES